MTYTVITPDDSLLLIIDIQERLCAAMDQTWLKRVIHHTGLMALYARLEKIPVIVTEQYPQGLGGTHPDVLKHLDGCSHQNLAKTAFGCGGDAAIVEAMAKSGRKKIIVVGMETHICAYLTVLDLCQRGYEVFMCVDATIARGRDHYENGLDLMEQAGAFLTNTETLVFQMMGCSGGETFKAISNYLKQSASQ